MTATNPVVSAYLDTWNETDPAARRALLDAHWTPAAAYTDPLADVAGADQLDATIDAVQQQFPGFVFTPLGEPDAHHDQVRFRWGLGPAGAEPVVEGSDVVLTESGRIARVLGFLDKLPS